MTATDIEDPFAKGGAADADEFDDPKTEFISTEDLVDRIVIVVPHSKTEATSRQTGEKYERVTADVVIVNGPTTAKIPTLPFLVKDMYLSAGGVVLRIKGNIGTGRPVVGVVDAQPSSYNKKVDAYSLQPATPEQKEKARPAWAQYKAGQFS